MMKDESEQVSKEERMSYKKKPKIVIKNDRRDNENFFFSSLNFFVSSSILS